MTAKKIIKVTIASVLGASFLMFAILLVHIAIMVKGRKPLENPTIQMARADFRNPLMAADINGIQQKIKNQKGVKDVYFNAQTKILVYSFDATINSAQNIYDAAIKNSGYDVQQFTFAKNEVSNGCPAMDTHSMYGKLTAMVETVIH